MKKYLVIPLMFMVISVLPACSNTGEGAGRDIEGWGRWMQDTF